MKTKKGNNYVVKLILFWVVVVSTGLLIMSMDKPVEKSVIETGNFVKEYHNIARLFYQEHFKYTFLVEVEKDILEPIFFNPYYSKMPKCRYLKDLAPSELIWVKAVFDCSPDQKFVTANLLEVEIHIHSVDDINSAGWDHGKFGHGTTTVIE